MANKYWAHNIDAFVLCLVSYVHAYMKGQELVWSSFREVAEHHLESGAPSGGLEELHQEAELWAFNTDFSLEFPQPLMPYTVLVGGVLNKPANPLEQVYCLDRAEVFKMTFFTFATSMHNHLSLILPYPMLCKCSSTPTLCSIRILSCGSPVLERRVSLL